MQGLVRAIVGATLLSYAVSALGADTSSSSSAAAPIATGAGEWRVDLTTGIAITDTGNAVATPSPPPPSLDENLAGLPVLAGAHVSYFWRDDVGAEFWGSYQFDIHRWQFLVGPRFRVRNQLVSFGIGLKAGVMLFESLKIFDGTPRLLLSPDASAELDVGRHLFFGIRYAFDLPVHSNPILTHRVMFTDGWRF